MAQDFVAATVLNIDDIKNQLRKASDTINVFRTNTDTIPFRDRVVVVSDQSLGNHFTLDHPDNGILDSSVLELDTGLGVLTPVSRLWVNNTVKEFFYVDDFIDTSNSTASIDISEAIPSSAGTPSYPAIPGGTVPSPIAHYLLNSDASDELGNYDGTNSGVTFVTGKLNNAGYFDGSARIVADYSGLRSISGSMSVAFWFKSPTQSVDWATLFTRGGTWGNAGHVDIQHLQTTSSTIRIEAYDLTPNNCESTTSGLTDDEWHHFVGVIDGSTNYYHFYIDGELDNSVAFTGSLSACSVGGLELGDRSSDRYYTGSLDDVRIYDYALDASHVSILYNSNIGVSDTVATTAGTPSVPAVPPSAAVPASRKVFLDDGEFFLSKQLTKGVDLITDATFLSAGNITASLGTGGSINYYLTADDGVNWEQVTLGNLHTFTNQGSNLLYKIEASNALATINLLNDDNTPEPIVVSYIN